MVEKDPDVEYVAQGAAKRTADAIYLHIQQIEKAMLIGDERLADHIAQQVLDIRNFIQTAENLELERIEGLRREIGISHAASEKAIEKQEVANEKRFQSVNEFRAQLSSQQTQFMPREVVEKEIDAIEKRIIKLEREDATGTGRRMGSQNLGSLIFALVGAAGTLIAIVLVVGDVLTK